MIMYDAQLQEATLEGGEIIPIPRWVAKAAADIDDPCQMIRFWLRSQQKIGPTEEVMMLDLSSLEAIPVEAPAPV